MEQRQEWLNTLAGLGLKYVVYNLELSEVRAAFSTREEAEEWVKSRNGHRSEEPVSWVPAASVDVKFWAKP